MKNLALIASILTLINCTTTSNFSKRKYTNGRMQSSLTTTKYNKSIQEKSIQKSGNRDTAISKHVKNKETNEILLSITEKKILSKKSANTKEKTIEKMHIEEPRLTKKGKIVKKAHKIASVIKQRSQISYFNKNIVSGILASVILSLGITLLVYSIYVTLTFGFFSFVPIFWFLLSVEIFDFLI